MGRRPHANGPRVSPKISTWLARPGRGARRTGPAAGPRTWWAKGGNGSDGSAPDLSGTVVPQTGGAADPGRIRAEKEKLGPISDSAALSIAETAARPILVRNAVIRSFGSSSCSREGGHKNGSAPDPCSQRGDQIVCLFVLFSRRRSQERQRSGSLFAARRQERLSPRLVLERAIAETAALHGLVRSAMNQTVCLLVLFSRRR